LANCTGLKGRASFFLRRARTYQEMENWKKMETCKAVERQRVRVMAMEGLTLYNIPTGWFSFKFKSWQLE
jgi:hypothetical protein